MPFYQYQCKSCHKEWTEYHGYDESPLVCPFCDNKNFRKIYNYTTLKISSSEITDIKKENKIGQKTRQFIEESRKELEEQKENMRGK